jgi:CRISPR-associated endonuclease/helicase Cas3
MNHDREGKHRPLAQPAAGGEAAPPLGGDPAESGAEHGLRGGTSDGGEDSRGTRPERATRFIETTQGVLSCSELAPLLADRVAAVEESIAQGGYAEHPLDEWLILDLHRRICGDLVPEWAGKWRDIEVRVGRLEPPPPFQLPMLMRDYGLDLQARWPEALGGDVDRLLEFMAFAEGRFLTIHPFRDFNGRTIRLFLSELLRRLDLPEVNLAPEPEQERQRYFTALAAADALDWEPLMTLWNERLAASEAN